MRFRFSCLFVVTLVTFAGLVGCGGGSPTVKPKEAETVAPDSQVGEEKPSMDEK